MSEFVYENMPVAISQKGDDYAVGVVIHGTLFPFFVYPGGSFDQDVQAAQDAENQREAVAKSEQSSTTPPSQV